MGREEAHQSPMNIWPKMSESRRPETKKESAMQATNTVAPTSG
jgi:hypothetical protein